jgi:hypothetical protein
VNSKLETDLERMWKETIMAEFDIISRILSTYSPSENTKKIILMVIPEIRFELWTFRTRGITSPSVPQR